MLSTHSRVDALILASMLSFSRRCSRCALNPKIYTLNLRGGGGVGVGVGGGGEEDPLKSKT
jgi:hypothetical protein